MSSAWFPGGGSGAGRPPLDDTPETTHIEPVDAREMQRRWVMRALEWRAVALAEAVFGGPVEPRLASQQGFGPLDGMLELSVPFADLDTHRVAEASFLDAARRDPVLGGFGLVYLFRPMPGDSNAPRLPAPFPEPVTS